MLRRELRGLGVCGIEGYVERCRVALPVVGQIEQQFVPDASEDAILAVPQVALSLFGVRPL